MPSRQKMQETVRPSTGKKAAATAPPDVKSKSPSTTAASKPTASLQTTQPKVAATPAAVKTSKVTGPAKVSGGDKPSKPAKSVEIDKSVKPDKDVRQKHKLVRDSFTLPREDFELIQVLKERALGFQRPTKKSELLRAGLQALAKLDAIQLQRSLDGLITLSPGRPKKHR